MNTEKQQAHTYNEEDQKWMKIIDDWRQSDMSIAEWCRDHDLSYSQFNHQKRRLFPEVIRKNEFLEQPTTWSTLTMELPSSSIDVIVNDCRIIVSTGFDQDLFQEIVEVLKNAH